MTRLLWGVLFNSGESSMLLFEAWHWQGPRSTCYDGEPTRPLLFRMRRQAHAWCLAERARYVNHVDCSRWRFRAVRVRETVEEVL